MEEYIILLIKPACFSSVGHGPSSATELLTRGHSTSVVPRYSVIQLYAKVSYSVPIGG